MMYKIGEKVKVNNRNSTFPQDNRGTIVKTHIQYIVKLDGGLTGLFNTEDVSKLNDNRNS